MKFYIALLSLMLVIVLVFTAFGIPYAKNNFVGTVVTVEGYLNDFSGWLMNFYKTIHNLIDEWLPKIADTLRPLGDLITNVGEVFMKIDEKFGIMDSISESLETFLQWLKEVFTYWAIFFDFISERGVHFFDNNWLESLRVSLSCNRNDEFFKTDGTFDYEKMYRYVDALIYGVDNEFSYLLKDYGNKNISDYVNFNIVSNTVVFYTGWSSKSAISYEDEYTYWFTTVDLEIPDNYFPFMSDDNRYTSYFDSWIPVFSSNFGYYEDDVYYYLRSIRFDVDAPLFTRSDKNGLLYPTNYYDLSFYGAYRAIDLRFAYRDDIGREFTKVISADDWIEDKIHWFFKKHYVKIEPEVLEIVEE